MTDPTTQPQRATVRFLSILLLLVFIAGLWGTLRPFILPTLWSIILVTATWPAFVRLRNAVPRPTCIAPLISSLLLGTILIVLFLPVPLRLAAELREIRAHLTLIEVAQIEASLHAVPLIGPYIAAVLAPLLHEPRNVAALLEEHQSEILSLASAAARGVLSSAATIGATLVGSYCLFRHGDTLLKQLQQILVRIGGTNTPYLLTTVTHSVRGAAYSVLATAFAQGLLAGIGYWMAGAPVPLLLTALTMVFALIPFGTPFVYLPVAAYLGLGTNTPWYNGVGLALWGVLIVSTVDNFLRSIFISHATKLSAVLVFMGVVGGIGAFGMVGVFVGPAIMTVAHWWWLHLSEPASQH